jgi:lipopolysaccharide biosynthesis protein
VEYNVVAFYLPQFHPIPENDAWWGKGFTEWTNVGKAKPLFVNHYQPHVPADLGYYDLRVPETRQAQAELARHYGVSAFCYWHYWFYGRRLLELPFNEVLRLGQPDFPFCLGWANQSWSSIWHGLTDSRTLIEQTHSEDDDAKHFKFLIPAFRDHRYYKINGRNLFLIYNPYYLPDAKRFTEHWRQLAREAELPDFHFVAHLQSEWERFGCDSSVTGAPFTWFPAPELDVTMVVPGIEKPRIKLYSDYVDFMASTNPGDKESPLVIPNWDNTPRSGVLGNMLHCSTPELFARHLRDGLHKASVREDKMVFIKAWNEWGEGNHMEPDLLYGLSYLQVLRDCLNE